MEMNPQTSPGPAPPGVWRTRARKVAIGFNTFASLALACLVWLMVNYLALRHHGRVDISRSQYYRLHPRTIEVLQALDQPVTAIVFFAPSDPLFMDVEALLGEFQIHSPRFKMEIVDPDRDPARAKELQTRYGMEKGGPWSSCGASAAAMCPPPVSPNSSPEACSIPTRAA